MVSEEHVGKQFERVVPHPIETTDFDADEGYGPVHPRVMHRWYSSRDPNKGISHDLDHPDAYGALVEDVRRRGVREPVSIDRNGVLDDGHHRWAAAWAAGRDVPVRRLDG